MWRGYGAISSSNPGPGRFCSKPARTGWPAEPENDGMSQSLSMVKELMSVVSANLQRGIRLRQSILQRVFTGGLQAVQVRGRK
jgi:hypothetical protein